MKETSFFQKCLLILFHPIDCMDIIKRESVKFKLLPVLILNLLAVAVNYIYIFVVHFPLSERNTIDANIGLELAMVVVPLFTWAVASYLLTAIMSGESHFTELLTAYSYSLVPYIIITPILSIVSNALSYEQVGVYFFFKYGALVWSLFLMYLALKCLNDYSIPKTILVTGLSIIAILVIWAVILLLFSLTIQFFTFFADVYNEIIFKF